MTAKIPDSARPENASSAWAGRILGVPWGEVHRLLPGLALAVAVMLLSSYLAGLLGRVVLRAYGIDPAGKASPVSGISG